MKEKRIFISTGEASSDEMAASVVRNLRSRPEVDLDLVAQAGPLTEAAGARTLVRNEEFSAVGINPGRILKWARIYSRVVAALEADPPDLFFGVAHHAFNVPLVKRLRRRNPGMRAVLLAPPETWAWDFVRGQGIVRSSGKLMKGIGLLPEDIGAVYADRGQATTRSFDVIACLYSKGAETYRQLARDAADRAAKVVHVGHPFVRYSKAEIRELLASKAQRYRRAMFSRPVQEVIGVFPGSRAETIGIVLPVLLRAALMARLRSERPVGILVSTAQSVFADQVKEIVRRVTGKQGDDLVVVSLEEAEVLLCACDKALLSSGTITLQAACLNVPSVIGYRLNLMTYLGGVFADYGIRDSRGRGLFGLPNLLAEDVVFPEFVGSRFRPNQISRALAAVGPDTDLSLKLERIQTAIRPGRTSDREPMQAVARLLLDQLLE